MRSPPPPRQWTAIALTAVVLPALTITAWPLIPFLTDLLPEELPLGRILWGLVFAAVLVAAAVLVRSQAHGVSVWLGWLILTAWTVTIAVVAGIVLVVWLILGSPGLEEVRQLAPKDLDAIATRAFAIVAGLGGVAEHDVVHLSGLIHAACRRIRVGPCQKSAHFFGAPGARITAGRTAARRRHGCGRRFHRTVK